VFDPVEDNCLSIHSVVVAMRLENPARKSAIGAATALSPGMTWPPWCSMTSGSANRSASSSEHAQTWHCRTS